MRVLFIHPGFPYRGKDMFPIGLGYLASAVEDIADISVIDENVEDFSIDRVKKINPDIIGITATTPSFPRAMEIAGALSDTDAKIVMGGVHATFMPEEALNNGADIVARGEGEATFREIVKERPLAQINGISWIKDKKIIHNPDRELTGDLDSVPLPAHKYFPTKEYGIMSITTSRGCPYSCSYCSATRFWKRRVRYRSPENVLDKNSRKIDVKTMENTFGKIKKYGLQTRAYITFGLPGETEKSVADTVKFLDEITPDQILLSLATAYPGTDLWGGPYIDMHENWVAKFHGHGTGGKLYLPEGITRKEYITLADYMWGEVKRINKARAEEG